MIFIPQRIKYDQFHLVHWRYLSISKKVVNFCLGRLMIIFDSQFLLQFRHIQHISSIDNIKQIAKKGDMFCNISLQTVKFGEIFHKLFHIFNSLDLVPLIFLLDLFHGLLHIYTKLPPILKHIIKEKLVLGRRKNNMILRLVSLLLLFFWLFLRAGAFCLQSLLFFCLFSVFFQINCVIVNSEILMNHCLIGPLGQKRSDRVPCSVNNQKDSRRFCARVIK
mmetsp:Transcript_9977/g.15088  ORF Transcript_9977/g.15088 Transcript_9977/m.15088 type:complete len:221 (+) Transcript_9977:209-871(+)